MTDMCKKGKQCDRYKQVNTSASPCPTIPNIFSLGCLDISAPELNFEAHKNMLKQKVNIEILNFELGKVFTNHKNSIDSGGSW